VLVNIFVRPDIEKKSVRARLSVRRRPYWVLSQRYNRALGYQKLRHGTYWVARYKTPRASYRLHRIGRADDNERADGSQVLNYRQAWDAADLWFQDPERLAVAAEPRVRGVRDQLSICPIGDEFTIGHALHDYVEFKRLVAAKSNFPILVSVINFHIVPKLASLPVDQFTPEAIRQYMREVLETPPRRGNQLCPVSRLNLDDLSAEELRKRKRTANSCLIILRCALRMAWENGRVDTERPWRIVKLFKNLKPARILHLSREECRRLLAHCRPDVGRLVLGALYTGCRVSELMEMRCSHVGRDGYGVYVPPQKGYRPRFIFLPDEGMAWFLQLIKGRRPDEYVFLNDNTNRRIGPSNKLFKNAVRAAGLPEDFTFHGLRHTYASQLAQAGAPILAIADQLGHLSARMVLETYGHLAPQIRESEVRQRFTTLSTANVRLAARQKKRLRDWRSSLHGADWRTYATITDLSSRRNSVDNMR